VDWADLVTLDLSKFDAPGGKQQLAEQLSDAVNRIGEWAVQHGYSRPSLMAGAAQASSISQTLV
jgi:hypothetical protein